MVSLAEKPLTGEPDAGNPPVRFGGRGGANHATPTPIGGTVQMRPLLTATAETACNSVSRSTNLPLPSNEEVSLLGTETNMSRPINADAALCEKPLSLSLFLTFMSSLHGLAPRLETMNQPLPPSAPSPPRLAALPPRRLSGRGEGQGDNSPSGGLRALNAREPPPLPPSAPSPPLRGRGKGRGGRPSPVQVHGKGEVSIALRFMERVRSLPTSAGAYAPSSPPGPPRWSL